MLLSQPPMIGYIFNFLLGKEGTDVTAAVAVSCTIVLVSLMYCFMNAALFYRSTLLGCKTRAAFTGIVYEKVLFMTNVWNV